MGSFVKVEDVTGVKIEENIEDGKDPYLIIKQQNEKIERLEAELREMRARQNLHPKRKNEETAMEVTSNNENSPSKKPKGESEESEESDEFAEHESMTRALKNPLILMKILRYMTKTADFLNSRLVNSEWNQLSTEILLKQNYIQLSFQNVENSSEFVLSKNKKLKLKELTSLLATSKGFPCQSYSFKGDLKCKDAQKFLKNYGKNIKEVKLEGEMDFKDVRKLLLSQVPNLNCLKLESLKPSNQEQVLFPKTGKRKKKTTQLVSLEYFELLDHHCPTSAVQEIVKSAPNLVDCRGSWCVEEAETLIPRIYILSGLALFPNEFNIEIVEKLADLDLKLDFLDVACNHLKYFEDEDNFIELKYLCGRFEKALAKIVSSSQETLDELNFLLCDKLLFEISWPRLENVRMLTVNIDFDEMNGSTFKLSQDAFPNLDVIFLNETQENVERSEGLISLEESSHFDFGFKFPFQGLAPSVTSFYATIPLNDVNNMPQVLPNLKDLYLMEVRNFANYSCLWKMNGLKTLELELIPTKFNTLWRVDKMFTGFGKSICQFLYTFGKDLELTKSQLEKLRTKPSILDLKNLRGLHLGNKFRGYEDDEDFDFDDSISKGISLFSKKYAFDLHPSLRLTE